MNSKTKYTQTSLVIEYLKNNRRKLTTKEITAAINKKYRTSYSSAQISKCLNKFANRNMVKSFPNQDQPGNLWMYRKS